MKRRHLGTNPLHGAFHQAGVLDLFNIKKEKAADPTKIKEEDDPSPDPTVREDKG